MNQRRQQILVTVGMGPWPFDRLIGALSTLPGEYDVFAQTGTSSVEPPCAHAPFISYRELTERIDAADIVITHAGNTVRLAQRAGKVPIAVAREQARGEMGNDHQVTYLRLEEQHGRVIAVRDVELLAEAVTGYQSVAARLTAERPVNASSDPETVAELLDETCARLIRDGRDHHLTSTPGWHADLSETPADSGSAANPFQRHPLRRYTFAWDRLSGLTGPHLDIGAGFGDFAGPLAATSDREVHAVDASAEYATEISNRYPGLRVDVVPPEGPITHQDAAFTSVSMLDVLEHVADEEAILAEAHRLLAEGGVLVVTVPRRHVFSWLDPDNAKYRWPRLHRRVYEARYGREAYHRRFVDTSDDFFGDISVSRDGHTNYRTADLLSLLRRSGFVPEVVSGANLFWRWLQIPCLLGGRRVQTIFGPAIRVDGELFTSPRFAANLFVQARRVP